MYDGTPDPPPPTRRDFLLASGRLVGGGWLALQLPLLSSLAACAREAAERGEPFTTLSTREGETVAAFAETILPSDDLPGAREAGAAHFVDRALGELFPDWLALVRGGVEDLERRAGREVPAAAAAQVPGGVEGEPHSAFAALPDARREAILHEVEEAPYFFVTRMLVVMGVFADPAYGGNRDGAGWAILDMAHAPAYEPPFGHYDRDAPDASAGGPTGGA